MKLGCQKVNYVVETQVVHRPVWLFKVTCLLQVDYGELGHAVVHIKEALLKVFTVRLNYTKAKLKDGAE